MDLDAYTTTLRVPAETPIIEVLRELARGGFRLVRYLPDVDGDGKVTLLLQPAPPQRPLNSTINEF